MPDVKISIRPNGPYLIEGPVALTDTTGNAVDTSEQKIIALCRCGGSATKPYCDGSHRVNGFIDPPEPVDPADPADPADVGYPVAPAA